MKVSFFAGVAVFLGASAITSPAIANENDGKGWYGTAGIGFVSPNDLEGDECLTLSGSEYCADYDLGLDSGLSGEIGIGYDFGKIRIEATYSRDNTSMDDLDADVTENGVEVATLSTEISDSDKAKLSCSMHILILIQILSLFHMLALDSGIPILVSQAIK